MLKEDWVKENSSALTLMEDKDLKELIEEYSPIIDGYRADANKYGSSYAKPYKVEIAEFITTTAQGILYDRRAERIDEAAANNIKNINHALQHG